MSEVRDAQKDEELTFSQWSEVHEITRPDKTRLAQVNLQPAKFQIAGPDELVIQTRTMVQVMEGQDTEEIKAAIYEVWSHWHVICSVTGEKILLCDLRYWDMNGLIYSSPCLIPENRKPPVQ